MVEASFSKGIKEELMADRVRDHLCSHAIEIADALARHDFPGLPSIVELDDSIQTAYEDIAEDALLRDIGGRTDG